MTVAAVARANVDLLLRGVDRPVRVALELSEGPLWRTLLPGALGLALVALTHAVAIGLGPAHGVLHGLDALRPALEALAVVCPGAFVASGLIRLKTSHRMRVAAMSLGILAGGLLSFSLLPLIVFLALAVPDLAPLPAFLVTTAFLGGAASVHRRVVTADASVAARIFAGVVSVLLVIVFALRILPFLLARIAQW